MSTPELMFPEKVILEEISNERFKRDNIAKTYAMILNSSEEIDFRKINNAIINRWSFAGLEYIKKAAHDIKRINRVVSLPNNVHKVQVNGKFVGKNLSHTGNR